MERLDEMLDRKLERERPPGTETPTLPPTSPGAERALTAASRPVTAASDKPSTTARICWLCNHTISLRFRLQGTIFLCFNCFRISYLSLLLPIIDTPTRRKSDAAFLKLIYAIEDERNASVSSLGEESLASTYGEVIEPRRASFVMNSSMIRQRRVKEEQLRISNNAVGDEIGGGTTAATPITSARSMWSCPRCTFLNAALARECEACGFVNPGTVHCLVCNVRVPIGVPSTPAAKSPSNRCKNGEPHRIWNCRECGGLNTVDGDRCSLCRQPRYWACSHCTALHHVARGEDGLRYCPTCGNYNTPDDVLEGQVRMEKEEKYAEMVSAQRDADAGGAGTPAAEEVVFGVNDAQTLEERARQREIENNEKRLISRLSRLHISRNVQKTDGNCLFSALANQLFGQHRLHYLVRSLCTAYMNGHAEDYSVLFDGEAEWRAYLAAMKEQGTWGDELCLNAAARCFRVNIHVITSDRDRWHIVFQHEQLGQSELRTRPPKATEVGSEAVPRSSPQLPRGASQVPPFYEGVSVFLAYLAPVHYDDITPSPVKPLMLGELLSGELNKRVRAKQRSRSGATSPTTKNSLQLSVGGTSAWAENSGSFRSAAPTRAPPVPVKMRTPPSETLRRSVLDGSTSSATTAPAVPRSRPNQSDSYSSHSTNASAFVPAGGREKANDGGAERQGRPERARPPPSPPAHHH